MKLTDHARRRIKERFPELNIQAEWNLANLRRTGNRLIKKIRKQCPGKLHVTKKDFKGYYYKVSPNNIVFVVVPPELIVTVFKLK